MWNVHFCELLCAWLRASRRLVFHLTRALAGRLQREGGLRTRVRRVGGGGHLGHPDGERLRRDPKVFAQRAQLRAALRERLRLVAAGGQLDGGDHDVLGGMLAADELEGLVQEERDICLLLPRSRLLPGSRAPHGDKSLFAELLQNSFAFALAEQVHDRLM